MTPVVPGLLGLRDAIDRALALIAQLEPVVNAWESALQPTTTNGAGAPGKPPAEAGEASDGATHHATCRECGAGFERRSSGQPQKYCNATCRKRASVRRRAAAAAPPAADLDPLPDDATRDARGGRPDDARSSAARLEPPPLDWRPRAGAA